MCKKPALFLILLLLLFAAFLPCAAVEKPVIPRVYRPEMHASVGYRGGEKYIALDVIINDITDPTGLLGIEFNILFDGDALIPLWQTDKELNGDGKNMNNYTPPQMVTNWPKHNLTIMGQSFELFAAEGLCKSYKTTGKGVLNVAIVTNIDYCEDPVFGDGDFAIRLYFKPAEGFKAGSVYSFSIDGRYDETIPTKIQVSGVNGADNPQNAYGCGAEASCALTWADCGAYDLADTSRTIVPDGKNGILWVDGLCAVKDLKSCFKGEVRVLDTAGKPAADSAAVQPDYKAVSDDGALTIAVRGDINLDGIVSAADYLLLKGALSGETKLSGLRAKTADLSGEGALNTTDALRFRRLFKNVFQVPAS